MNKKRSERGKPAYGFIGGAIKCPPEETRKVLNEISPSEYQIEKDDLRVSGVPVKYSEQAINALLNLARNNNPLEQLLREIEEELGKEILTINEIMGTNIKQPEHLKKIVKEVQEALSHQNYRTYIFGPEKSSRNPNQLSQRIALLFETDLTETPELLKYIQSNSGNIGNLDPENPPLFLRLSDDQIRKLLENNPQGENYFLENVDVAIASQIEILK
jgi:NADH dehydrogenase/NADH:ubiquinone oxidoreductase subunit G